MNVDIELSGLTSTQCVIADFLWEVDSQEDMDTLLAVFGDSEVQVVQELMVAAAFDEVTDLALANEVLGRFM